MTDAEDETKAWQLGLCRRSASYAEVDAQAPGSWRGRSDLDLRYVMEHGAVADVDETVRLLDDVTVRAMQLYIKQGGDPEQIEVDSDINFIMRSVASWADQHVRYLDLSDGQIKTYYFKAQVDYAALKARDGHTHGVSEASTLSHRSTLGTYRGGWSMGNPAVGLAPAAGTWTDWAQQSGGACPFHMVEMHWNETRGRLRYSYASNDAVDGTPAYSRCYLPHGEDATPASWARARPSNSWCGASNQGSDGAPDVNLTDGSGGYGWCHVETTMAQGESALKTMD